MAELEPYRKRLKYAIHKEFKTVWTAYRYWTVAASFLASLGTLFTRFLLGARVELQDIIINGLTSGFLAFGFLLLGTYIISRRKAAEVLDGQAHKQISSLRQDLENLKFDPAEENHFKTAEQELASLSDDCKQVLRHIYENQQVFAGPDLARIRGIESTVVSHCLYQLEKGSLVRKRESRDREIKIWWEMVPAFRLALGKLLYR